MLKFNPTMPLLFYRKTSTYTPGTGAATVWAAVITDVLFCEWKGGYGDRALAAESVGVSDMAIVRTFYHPDIYIALQNSQVIVAKNADSTVMASGLPNKNNANCYELWGGVDNVGNENKYIEFRVRRYEAK